ncbi:hypothetical protein LNJ08_12675 [Tenacibaculum finnmarkense genomovar ulcerans]|uniref:hypothetical protein n=1 Tax=Tenacibaculum finnmarkense TaxID=2781243 RepID=UPI001E343F63|nr:hypothetical protein [Tenacibaculum finnmarkense]MCD8455244.1 hypothetical protein [Tenacibaculum finnmarkense genomovar ulcerans]
MTKKIEYSSNLERHFTQFEIKDKTYTIYFSEEYYKILTEEKLEEIFKFVNSSEFKLIITEPLYLLSLLAQKYFSEYKIKNEDLTNEFDFTFDSITLNLQNEYELDYYLYLTKQNEGDNYGTWKSTHQNFGSNVGKNTIIKIERKQH